MYYSIVILTILYYLRVADLMGITSPYPRENIIAGNYILADMRAYLNKRHRQQNNEILIKHSPGMGECFGFSGIQITEKNQVIAEAYRFISGVIQYIKKQNNNPKYKRYLKI